MTPIAATDVRSYYQAALAALRFVEARHPSNRRFGEEADARWRSFRGELTTADRIDLLLRDANAEWPGSFGAQSVFPRITAADDDAFGPDWLEQRGFLPTDAESLWRSQSGVVAGLDALLEAWSSAWDVSLCPLAPHAPMVAGQYVIAGPSAVAAALRDFVARDDSSWADRVVVVAAAPAHRQLAAWGSAVTRSVAKTRVLTPAEFEREADVISTWTRITSSDCDESTSRVVETSGRG